MLEEQEGEVKKVEAEQILDDNRRVEVDDEVNVKHVENKESK